MACRTSTVESNLFSNLDCGAVIPSLHLFYPHDDACTVIVCMSE